MMKQIIFITAAIVLLQGCRTTEENYRSSYETATKKLRAEATDGIDSETYNKIIAQQRPKTTVIGEDSVPMANGYAWQFYGKEYPLCKYNVVVGAMKQQFNAKAFCDRLRQAGCESYVITDRDKNYFHTFQAANRPALHLRHRPHLRQTRNSKIKNTVPQIDISYQGTVFFV